MNNNKNNNRKEGAAMKRYAFITNDFAVVTVAVNEDDEIVKLCHFMPRAKTIIRMTNPKIVSEHGTFLDGPFDKFDVNKWMNGGNFYIASDDLYQYSIRATYIPVCQECGIAFAHEYIGYWSTGGKFSQGYDKKCWHCLGFEEEPAPWVSEVQDLAGSMINALFQILIGDDDEEENWDYDPDEAADTIIASLPDNWDINDILKEGD